MEVFVDGLATVWDAITWFVVEAAKWLKTIAWYAAAIAAAGMILDLLETGDKRDITLVYGARNQAELYYYDLFRELAGQHDNFHYLAALSEPAETDDWDGPCCFVHELAEQYFDKRFEGYKAYLCGPPPMVDSCITSLMRGRLFEEHIFMENFFTAADSEKPARRSALFKKF